MTSLATVQDLAERMGTQFDPTNLRAIRALEDASALVQGYTNRSFGLVEDEEVVLHGSGTQTLLLPEFPVLEVTDVTLLDSDGTMTTLVFWGAGPWGGATNPSIYYRLVAQQGILVRVDCIWPKGYANVLVTYTHGYAVIPDGIKAATCEIAARLEATTASVGSSGLVTSETVGNYSVTYGDTGGGAVDSSGLTADERAMLDPFRQVPLV